MSKIKEIIINGKIYRYVFFCPACKREHYFDSSWQFNKDLDNPTITPSILTLYPSMINCCHSVITNGKISFCSDCSHDFKGQTLELRNDDENWGQWIDEQNKKEN
jgi:Family of unknown function (DUF6527)